MSSGNSGKSSNNESGCRNKLNLKIDNIEKNMIDPSCKMGGTSTLGDGSGNFDDNPVPGNTKNKINVGGNEILKSLAALGMDVSKYAEVELRINNEEKNKIGTSCEIKGDSIVGDGARNTYHVQIRRPEQEHHELVRRPEQEHHEQQPKRAEATTKKGGGHQSNSKDGGNNRRTK